MTILHNEIEIAAPIETIWESLSNIEELEKYDPTVKRSVATSQAKHGKGAARRVDMLDGKSWFEETCTHWQPNQGITYELTACSFPVSKLQHNYQFETVGNKIKVKQTMTYQIKFGWLGKILDALIVRKQTNAGINKFLQGLKRHSEQNYHGQ